MGMEMMLSEHKFALSKLSLMIAFAVAAVCAAPVHAVDFNTDVLDLKDKANIDFSRFSQANYILPGQYHLSVHLNDQTIKEYDIRFQAAPGKPDSSVPCVTAEMVTELGLKPEALGKVTWWPADTGEQCADLTGLDGASVQGDLSTNTLQINIPQAYLEYSDPNWVPPSRWDNGEPGLLLDYNVNTSVTRPQMGNQTQDASVNGTVGANAGAWRLRGDYQGSYNHTTGQREGNTQNFAWSRVYLFRAVPRIHATVSLGENYLASNLFDSWRYTGVSLNSDDRMLPPSLRGYAPEVTGIARTNARVTVSQQGRVIYETTVPSGPFRIQDLSSAVSGKLDVKVEEQDGSTQTFQVDTATIPYLTRPGMLQYRLASGRPSSYDHHAEGPLFTTGEFSWGITNGWSLYGGAILAGDYNSGAVGIGRDLYALGALSADVTQSYAKIPDKTNRQGKSWRVSYSKRFDDINSEITFAGYRFSERNYMSMGEYLDARYREGASGHNKELYTVTASKGFDDLRLSMYLSYSHQTYWDRAADDRFSLSASTYFDLGPLQNTAMTLSATRSQYMGRNDDMMYLSLSVPWGGSTLSYNGQYSENRYSQTASFYDRIDNNNNYRLSAGNSLGNGQGSRSQGSGYFTHHGDVAEMTANLSYSQNSYTSMGLSLAGGATVTPKGAALHAGGGNGATRLMVDTDGVSGVPVDGGREHSNAFGIAVVPDIGSYYRNSTSLDLTSMPDDVEASQSVVESALTDGAIGYRQFAVVQGAKAMAVLALADGSHPPFGATVTNGAGHELAVVADGGLAWLTGLKEGATLNVNWNGKRQCQVTIPAKLDPVSQLLLPCVLAVGGDMPDIRQKEHFLPQQTADGQTALPGSDNE